MAIPASGQTPPSGEASVAAGILLMIGAVASFTIIDSCAKVLTQTLPLAQVVFARYGLSLVYVIVLMWATGAFAWRSQRPGLQLVRGSLLLSSTFLNFLALQYLRLDQTSAIAFSNPLWVCALSPLLLGEKVGPRRWAAVIVGFLGVLLIIRPGTGSFHWAMLISVLVAVVAALYQITTRKVGGSDVPLVSLLAGSAVGTLGAAPFGLAAWQMPAGAGLGLMLLMGLAGGFSHHLLIKAHTLAPAPALAPFVYTQIIWMVLAGYLLFSDVPDLMTLAGSAVVVASGLYVYYRERHIARMRTKGGAA